MGGPKTKTGKNKAKDRKKTAIMFRIIMYIMIFQYYYIKKRLVNEKFSG